MFNYDDINTENRSKYYVKNKSKEITRLLDVSITLKNIVYVQ